MTLVDTMGLLVRIIGGTDTTPYKSTDLPLRINISENASPDMVSICVIKNPETDHPVHIHIFDKEIKGPCEDEAQGSSD